MKHGAVVPIAWAALLLVLGLANLLWAGAGIQASEFAFAVLVVAAFATATAALPCRSSRPRAIPGLSVGSLGIGVGIAMAVYGLAFAGAVAYVGLGLLAVSLARVALELRAQRRHLRRFTGARR